MYRFLRRPRWIVFTAATLGVMVAMVNLSLWQLRRLDERKATNREVSTRSALAPAALDTVLPPTASLGNLGAAPWRRVEVSGTYDVAHQVLVNDRSLQGLPGLHVVTPLLLPDGRALLVNRGWIPQAPSVDVAPEAPPPLTGPVTVVGRVRPTQTRGWLGPRDRPTGTLARVARVDVARIGLQVPEPLVPAYVELVRADDGALPRPLPLPDLDEGPHLSYAGQWLLFTILAGAGWVALVRRHAKLARQAARRAELAGERKVAELVALTPAGPATTNGDHPPPGAGAAPTERPGTAGP